MTFQRVVQTLSLTFFLWLLWQATFPLHTLWPVETYLKLDPLNAIGVSISSRMYLPAIWFAVLILVLTGLLGRFFCGYLCPLGITVDITDRCLCRNTLKASFKPYDLKRFSDWRWIKYAILTFISLSAILGVSFLFLASPVCLITQFYGLVLTPAFNLIIENSLQVLRPLADYFDFSFFAYLDVSSPRYQYHWLVALTFTAIFACGNLAPRFWCRYFCPSGGLFAIVSWRPILRRHVSDDCTHCGLCQEKCPMAAIEEDPFITNHRECITCNTCARVCPTKAITFNASVLKAPLSNPFSLYRRKLITTGLFSMGAAAVAHTSVFRPSVANHIGSIAPDKLLRPPGAIPEIDFLAKCIRCGLCMKACPTNTLQPLGLDGGLSAYFSPILRPRRGPCEPHCNVCGQVCPTNAIRRLPKNEKLWAKVGTAYILRHKCLAWEFDKKCLVCDEVCPFGAITLKRVQGASQVVPFVTESRCNGCGYCEHHCPVQNQSAIIIEPMDAFRLSHGNYKTHGKQRGFSLSLRTKSTFIDPPSTPSNGLPPGFTD